MAAVCLPTFVRDVASNRFQEVTNVELVRIQAQLVDGVEPTQIALPEGWAWQSDRTIQASVDPSRRVVGGLELLLTLEKLADDRWTCQLHETSKRSQKFLPRLWRDGRTFSSEQGPAWGRLIGLGVAALVVLIVGTVIVDGLFCGHF